MPRLGVFISLSDEQYRTVVRSAGEAGEYHLATFCRSELMRCLQTPNLAPAILGETLALSVRLRDALAHLIGKDKARDLWLGNTTLGDELLAEKLRLLGHSAPEGDED